jgi:saccharopine dehydrogenase-like NADP-dependent oxidoreductase
VPDSSGDRVDPSRATVLVLGVGIQGRAVVEDLDRSAVGRVIAADTNDGPAREHLRSIGAGRTSVCHLDARDQAALRQLVAGVDLVVNMLPAPFEEPVLRVAIDAGVHLVSTNYAHHLRAFDEAAARRGIIVMPEAGFDPGIDLVIARQAVEEFDEIDTLVSYGAGIPAPECRDVNPINYKISWSFEGVLRAYARPARVVVDGRPCEVDARNIFDPAWTHLVSFDGLGEFEAFVNGDAVEFLQLLGIERSVRTSARYSLRWPGHCEFWRRLAHLGFLDEEAVAGTGLSPREFVRRHLEPRLHYGPGERDMIMLRIDARGTRGGQRAAARWELVECADAQSGVLAMSRAVGCPASIVAQMILGGAITRKGVGCPARDVPPAPFFDALQRRGITIRRTTLEGSGGPRSA